MPLIKLYSLAKVCRSPAVNFNNILSQTFVGYIRCYSVSNYYKSNNYEVNEPSLADSKQQYFSTEEELNAVESGLFSEESQNAIVSPKNSKILKSAIIGPPNVGKSTLINQIVGRQIFAISTKVHTTRCRARAVHTEGLTQLVFLDTPGLVSGKESNKHNLEKSFHLDGETAIQEADVVAIVHDVSNDRYSNRLDPKVLRLLHFNQDKHVILIINKVDCLKSKRVLLDIADILTCNNLKNNNHTQSSNEDTWSPKTEFTVNRAIRKRKGWPHFKEVFMVSALEGSGVGDIKQYLLNCAKPGDWLFPNYVFTDQTYVKMIEEVVQSKLLDLLPNEVPYNLSTQLEYYDRRSEGSLMAVVLVGCDTPRIEKLVMGSGGKRIKDVAEQAERNLANTFRVPVRLRLVVTKKKRRTVDIDTLVKSGSLDLLHREEQ